LKGNYAYDHRAYDGPQIRPKRDLDCGGADHHQNDEWDQNYNLEATKIITLKRKPSIVPIAAQTPNVSAMMPPNQAFAPTVPK
jgi:hypothetical protein